MKLMITIIIFLFCNTLYAETARELNTRGFRLYKQHRYVEALELFKKATLVNPKYALGFYNAASTLGVLHKKSVCEYDAYKSTINKYLKRSVQLDPRRGIRMRTDSDLDPVHDTFIYQRLLGLGLDKSADVRKILRRVSWYGKANGAMGPGSRIYFKAKGKVILQLFSLGEQGLLVKNEMARYKVSGRKITIYRKTKSGQKIIMQGSLTWRGELLFDNKMPASLRYFSDDASNCSA